MFSKKARLKVEHLFLTFSFDRAMIASWQTIVLYFMMAGRPVFLVLLLHTISGPSTARTISAPLRRTSRCIQKFTASSPNRSPAQRVRFGSGGARKRADDVFIKKRRSKANFAPTWWRRVDSNHRSETQQIYSLPPLATRELLQI